MQKRIYKIFILLGVLISTFQANAQIEFIENKGQWPEENLFVANFPGGKIGIEHQRLIYYFDPINPHALEHAGHGVDDEQRKFLKQNAQLVNKVPEKIVMNFENANGEPVVLPALPSKVNYNYYYSNDPQHWGENCTAYQQLVYQDLYDGIDLKLYTENGRLKYDMIVEEGSDPGQIRFRYEGPQNLFIKTDQLFLEGQLNTIVENRPIAFEIDKTGKKKTIACKFKLENNQVRFEFPKGYNKHKQIIIDPELIFSTFSGSTADNFGYTACYDDDGNLYSGGIVFGAGFPDTNSADFNGGLYDIGILKYDSSGQNLLYATYIGGNSQDTPHSLVVNNNQELLILGTTGSMDYPTSVNAYDTSMNGGDNFSIFGTFSNGSDLTITKLSETGNLIASTFIGSTENDGILKMNNINNYLNPLIQNYGDYIRGDIIIDENDDIYISSSTEGNDFPVMSTIQPDFGGGLSDAVVFKMNSNLTELLWSTYFGGLNEDAAYSIKVDENKHVYVGGGTNSNNITTTSGVLQDTLNGGIDGFIASFDVANDSILHSTYIGTKAYDQVYFIDLDLEGNIYAFGQTRGEYPITEGVFAVSNSGQFIHKMTNQFDSTLFSTVFGSGTREPNISPTAFLVNECDNIFLSGWGGNTNNGNSPNNGNTFNMPTTSQAFSSTTDGSDFYLMALSSDGKDLLYATYFGSTNNGGDHVDGGTSRFDKRGIVYQSVCSCGGSADNFPTTVNAWSTVNKGVRPDGLERCNNAAFKFDLATLEAKIETNNVWLTEPGVRDGCAPFKVLFINASIGGIEFEWDLGDGTLSTNEDSVVHVYEVPGIYDVKLTIRDINTCTVMDIDYTTITVHDFSFDVTDDFDLCEGLSASLTGSGGNNYNWMNMDRETIGTTSTLIINPDSSTTYFVHIEDVNSCIHDDTVNVNVIHNTSPAFTFDTKYDCQSTQEIHFLSETQNADAWLWDFGDGTTSTEPNPSHFYEEFGTYSPSLTITSAHCINRAEQELSIADLFVPNVVTLNHDGVNESFELRFHENLPLKIFNRWGQEIFHAERYENNWPSEDVNPGVYYYETMFEDGTKCTGWVHLLN